MLFGTDGIRGLFGAGLDSSLAFAAGRAAAFVWGGGRVLLAMDTRVSGRELYTAVRDGLLSGGADVLTLGILPTPAVSFLVKKFDAAGGIMVTASHNPPEYNGIKFLAASGYKLSDEDEQQIAHYIKNAPKNTLRGRLDSVSGGELYLQHIDEAVGDFGGVSVVVDCGFGALYWLAEQYFCAHASRLKVVCGSPDGANINCGCGALYPSLAGRLTESDFDIAFSFDGDGDRVSVSRAGSTIDGDSVLYNLSQLTNAPVVVGTILSNSALERKLKSNGKQFFRTPVGDKHIARLMQKNNYMLGGEQSGHYIIRPHAKTGDALLTAALIAKHISRGETLQTLALTPQKTISKFALPDATNRPDIKAKIAKAKERLKGGRLIVRMSGTEAKLRITAEHENETLVDEVLKEFEE